MGATYSLAGETADVGLDAFSPVTDDYDPWDNGYIGTIHEITIRLTGGEQETKSATRSSAKAAEHSSTSAPYTLTPPTRSTDGA